jgi:hypothetical protein
MLEDNVFYQWICRIKQLLEYLTLSDIYLFSSKDPNQAVSGTFAELWLYRYIHANYTRWNATEHGILLNKFDDSEEFKRSDTMAYWK